MTNNEIKSYMDKLEGKLDKVLEKQDVMNESLRDNQEATALVAADLKTHKESRFTHNIYITIIGILISGSCLLMGYVWGKEETKKLENGKQETVYQETQ